MSSEVADELREQLEAVRQGWVDHHPAQEGQACLVVRDLDSITVSELSEEAQFLLYEVLREQHPHFVSSATGGYSTMIFDPEEPADISGLLIDWNDSSAKQAEVEALLEKALVRAEEAV